MIARIKKTFSKQLKVSFNNSPYPILNAPIENSTITKKQGQKVKDVNGFTKKVQGLSDTANRHKFDCDGKKISVFEYFKQKKNINLK